MRNRAAGYVYWNLLLDSNGGPNIAGNFVDSPMYVHNVSAFVQNPSFFYLAHFSKFVPPGSRAMDASVQCNTPHPEYCQYVAFKLQDNSVVSTATHIQDCSPPACTHWFALAFGSARPLDAAPGGCAHQRRSCKCAYPPNHRGEALALLRGGKLDALQKGGPLVDFGVREQGGHRQTSVEVYPNCRRAVC